MVGILSEADILKGPLVAARKVGTETLGRPEDDAYADAAISQAKAQRVTDVMTKGVIAAHETASLREVADLMLKHKIKRVPIVRDGAILGIVSRVDLVKALISVGEKVYSPQPRAAVVRGSDAAARDNGFHERSGLGSRAVVRRRRPGRRRPPLGRGAKRRREAGLCRCRATGCGRQVTREPHACGPARPAGGKLSRS